MSAGYALLTSVGTCVLAAGLEGLCAGKNVKSFFAQLRFPPYSPPLWLWSIIGGLYYVIFCFVLFRLLRLSSDSVLRTGAVALVVFMMIVNALANYVIFRAKNLRLNFIIGSLFPVMDAALFICVIQLDTFAGWSMIPYLLYRAYAVWWCYKLWKTNRLGTS